jgi:hypothetical protein
LYAPCARNALVTAVWLTFRIPTKFHATIAAAGATAQTGTQSGFKTDPATQIPAPSNTHVSLKRRAATLPYTDAMVRFPPARSLSSSESPLATPLARLNMENPASQGQTRGPMAPPCR